MATDLLHVRSERPAPDTALLHLNGRFSGPGAGHSVLDEAGRLPAAVNTLVLDMQSVEYMDGLGVGIIAQLCCSMRASQRRLVLTGMNDRVRSILDAAGVLPLIDESNPAGSPMLR